MKYKTNLFNLYQKLVVPILAVVLCLTSITGTALLLNTSKTANAQTLQSSQTETTATDINQIEFDTNQVTKFGTRITETFTSNQIKTEPCGQELLISNPAAKYNPNTKATVIKSIKTACSKGESKQSWLKLVWDNGLIGWIRNPSEKIATVSPEVTPFQGVKSVGFGGYLSNLFDAFSIKASAQANTITCKDFTTQITDLKTLNQYPNLDLDDDGIGCEHLPKNPNDPNDQTQLFKNSFDTNKDTKVTCADFDSQVIDTEILTLFPRLDGDSDGVGCEGNSGVSATAQSNLLNGYTGSYNPYFADIQLDQTKLSNNTSDQNWSSLGKNLVTILQSDYKTLFGSDADCTTFDLGCRAINSLAGLGRRGMWMFHFVTGILQGIGQSIADLFTLIVDLLTQGLKAIQNILDGLYKLITNPSLIVKLVYDELESFTNGDYLNRANKLGRIIGSVLLDGIEFFTGIGIGSLAFKAVTKIATATKVTSKIVNFTKFVGKGYKIADKFEVALKTVKNGVGIARERVVDFAQTLSNSDWLDFVKYVDDADKPALQKLRDLLQKCAKQVAQINNFDIWNLFAIKVDAQATGGLCDVAKAIKTDLQTRFPTDFDPIKYDALVKGKTNTQVGEITANLYKDQDLWKKTVVLRSANAVNITSPTNYKKHLNLEKLSKSDLIKSTTNKQPAKYFGELKDIQKLEKTAFDFGMETINTEGQKQIWYKSKEIVGASGGKETKWINIDLTDNPKTFHGHPIHPDIDKIPKNVIDAYGR